MAENHSTSRRMRPTSLAGRSSEGSALIEELIAFATQPRFVYSHSWQTS